MYNNVIKSETLFTGTIFNVIRKTVTLPNDKIAHRDIVAHDGASAVVAVLDDGRILLVRQRREAAGEDVLEIPAGRLNESEDPLACIIRELEEETGYHANHIKLLTKFYPAIGYSTEIIYLFLAEGLTPGQPHTDEDEFVVAEAYSLDEALQMVNNGVIIDGKTMLAILWYARIKCGTGY